MLKQHSIICTSLINGLLFTYFLGSDTFHQALRLGVLSGLTLQQFLYIIAGLGAVVYFGCALLFQKKAAGGSEEKSLSKGILLKRSVQLYALILGAYLILVFLLMISYQLDSYWGSRLLLFILALNFFIPVITLSLISRDSLNKAVATPSETDRFLSRRGKNCNFKEAKQKREFWLFLFTFSIIIGIARMVDENATIIALHNSQKSENNQRTFQIFEIIGSFVTGVFLSLFRIYVSPYALLMINCFFLLASQILMFFIDVSNLALLLSVMIVAFVSGSSFVLAGQIAHEDYGGKHFNKILGIFMTGAAVGILIFEELVFD